MEQYGGFWIRVVAYIIDSIIINIGSGVLGLFFGVGLGAGLGAIDTPQDQIVDTAELTGALLGLLVSWLYFAVMESSAMQATLGKKVFGLIVVDTAGDRISFLRATGRYFSKILSALILLIGFIMVAFTERKQGLHDLIAGTLVVKGRPGEMVQASVFE